MFKLSKSNHLYFVTTKTKTNIIFKLDMFGNFSSDRVKPFTDRQKAVIKKYILNN